MTIASERSARARIYISAFAFKMISTTSILFWVDEWISQMHRAREMPYGIITYNRNDHEITAEFYSTLQFNSNVFFTRFECHFHGINFRALFFNKKKSLNSPVCNLNFKVSLTISPHAALIICTKTQFHTRRVIKFGNALVCSYTKKKLCTFIGAHYHSANNDTNKSVENYQHWTQFGK